MSSAPRLLAVATAVPPYQLRQAEVMERSRRLFSATELEIERMLPVYANAGIETRYSCVPLDWYLTSTNWTERNRLFIDNAVRLLASASGACLADAGMSADQVDAIVAVSTSGIATPSLDARLMECLPFRRDVQRLPIFGLGCAGGVLGLARAGALAQAAPSSTVLFLVVELCGLTFRANDVSKSNIVATALFGDGAAAALLRCEDLGSGPLLSAWGEHTWPDSLDVMGWRVEDDGFGVLFSRDIPSIVRQEYGAALDRFLIRQGLRRGDLDGFICHPGGAKIVAALEEVFELPPGAMKDARAVLREYGNMSAASVMFVLERALKPQLRGRYLVSALGPGFTAGFAVLEIA